MKVLGFLSLKTGSVFNAAAATANSGQFDAFLFLLCVETTQTSHDSTPRLVSFQRQSMCNWSAQREIKEQFDLHSYVDSDQIETICAGFYEIPMRSDQLSL